MSSRRNSAVPASAAPAYAVGDQAMAKLILSGQAPMIHKVDIVQLKETAADGLKYNVHFVGRHGKYDCNLSEHQLARLDDQEGIARVMIPAVPTQQPVVVVPMVKSTNKSSSSSNHRKQHVVAVKAQAGKAVVKATAKSRSTSSAAAAAAVSKKQTSLSSSSSSSTAAKKTKTTTTATTKTSTTTTSTFFSSSTSIQQRPYKIGDILYAQYTDKQGNLKTGEISVLEVQQILPSLSHTDVNNEGSGSGGGGSGGSGNGGDGSHDHLCYQYKVHWEGWGKSHDSVVSHHQLAR